MKVLNQVVIALALGLVTACGHVDNANQSEIVTDAASNTASTDEQSLGLTDDCSVRLSQYTYTQAAGQAVRFSYAFLQLSPGDSIKITNIANGRVVWELSDLPRASKKMNIFMGTSGMTSAVSHSVSTNSLGNQSANGDVEIPIAYFKNGEYRIQGITNTYLAQTAKQKVCGGGGKVVIRER